MLWESLDKDKSFKNLLSKKKYERTLWKFKNTNM